MQIKRFEAKSMTEALRQIKRELGPEAVILSAKDIHRENRLLGITRTCGVEVTAAVDAQEEDGFEPAAVGKPEPSRGRPDPDPAAVENRKRLIQRIQDVVRIGGRESADALPAVAGATPPEDGAFRPIQDRGLEPSWTERLSGAAAAASAGGALTDLEAVAAGLKQLGLSTRPILQQRGRQTLVALVGPSGVGKTTAAVKLAAFYKYRMHQAVGLVCLDKARLGGGSHLGAFGRVLGMPFQQASIRGGIREAVARLSACDVVIVDTPAAGPEKDDRMTLLREQLSRLPQVQVLLVMSATTRRADLSRIVAVYAAIDLHSAVLSKIDETTQIGDVVPALVSAGLATSYFASGSQVPFGFEEATLNRWAARLLGAEDPALKTAAPAAGADPEPLERPTAIHYLANRSSDIFHRSDCRWIRLIHEANVIAFQSFEEAVQHRFKPCRYCNPEGSASGSEPLAMPPTAEVSTRS